jgi:hypothetical protein
MGMKKTSPDSERTPERAHSLGRQPWRLLRLHAVGIGLSLLLAAALAAPRWWLLATDPAEGARINLSPWGGGGQAEDEAMYMGIARAIFDGDLLPRDVHLAHQHGPPITSAGPMYIVAGLGRVTGDIYVALAVVCTLAALATFLLIYALGLRMSGSRVVAAALGPAVLLVATSYDIAGGFLPLRHTGVLSAIASAAPEGEFHPWTRFVAPAVTAPLAFGAFLALPPAVLRGERRALAAASVLLALLAYTYLFVAATMAGVLLAWGVWFGGRRDWAPARRVLIIGGASAVLALPELANIAWNAAEATAYIRARKGFAPYTTDISTVAIVQRAAFALPFAWLAFRSRGDRDESVFYVLLTATPLVLARADRVFPQNDHFLMQVWPFFTVPIAIAGVVALRDLTPRGAARPLAAVLAVMAMLGIAQTAAYQGRALRENDEHYVVSEAEHDLYGWLDAHAGGATVATPSRSTAYLLANLTPAYGYLPDGFPTQVSDDEIADRYLRLQAAFGYSEADTFARLREYAPFTELPPRPGETLEQRVERAMSDFLFAEEFLQPDRIEERVPAWRERFRAYQGQEDVLGRYGVEYVLCDHRARFWEAGNVSPGTFVAVAFEEGEVTLYRIVERSAQDAREFDGCG